jgi:hypothetical protein
MRSVEREPGRTFPSPKSFSDASATLSLKADPVNSPPFRRLKQYGIKRPYVSVWAASAKND